MVLINGLSIDEINAALIALQRGQGEVVGGVKGTTVQNITISNSGSGTSSPDFSPQITSILEKNEEQDEAILAIKEKQNDLKNEVDGMVLDLAAHGVKGMRWDGSTNRLFLVMQDNRQMFVEIPSETVTLELDNSDILHFTMGGENDYYPQSIDVTLPYIRTSEKGEANGVATLDSTGRVPYDQLPESAMTFLGEWDASTNTPHLQDGTGTNGDFYVVSAGGTVNFGTQASPRNITFYPNDRVIYEGSSDEWFRLPAGEVRTVNGLSGDVTLTANNIDYSTGVTIKQKIDSIEPVQSDWTEDDPDDPAYIKNKIPIWIENGQADDNMTPVDNVTDGQMRPVTSNAVYDALQNIVTDAVTDGDMRAVTSNAVYDALGGLKFKILSDTYTVNNGYISINPQMADTNYKAFVQTVYGTTWNYLCTVQQYQANTMYIYVREGTGSAPANGTQIKLNILIVYW